MLFQTLDDKRECVGVYSEGNLTFDNIPEGLTKTWKASGSLLGMGIEYAWIYSLGKELDEVCPEHLREEYTKLSNKFIAYIKSFQTARLPLNEICFFDLVPETFLSDWCEIKNQICSYIFDTYERPANYDHLAVVHEMLTEISFQDLNLNLEGCRNLFVSSQDRDKVKSIMSRQKNINYNMFGTATGRLSISDDSFPILNLNKKYRKIIKPTNDWFVSLDFNGADIRSLLGLLGYEQPDDDIHEWNIKNFLTKSEKELTREEAKVAFFSWLYNPNDNKYSSHIFDKKVLLDKFYSNGKITNCFGRTIEVERDKAISYLGQSTTNDLTLDRAAAIVGVLRGKRSFVSILIHDEIVVDLASEDFDIVPTMKQLFSDTKLGKFKTNMKAGKDLFNMKELDL